MFSSSSSSFSISFPPFFLSFLTSKFIRICLEFKHSGSIFPDTYKHFKYVDSYLFLFLEGILGL